MNSNTPEISRFRRFMTFAVGGTTVAACTGQVNAVGAKTCTINNLAVGVNSITATYSGDSNFVAGSPGSASYTINKTSRPFGLSSSGPLGVNSSVTFTATLIGPFTPTTPTGTIAFSDYGTAIGSCTAQPIQASGANYVATCTVSDLTAGAHSIVADYAGDGNFVRKITND